MCLYCCLRSLFAASEDGAVFWVCSASLGNAVLGTSRQIAWLGLLMMVPCTLWLLRGRRKVLIAGTLAFISGCVIIVAAMKWFAHHPYTLPEHIGGIHKVWFTLTHPSIIARPVFEIPMLMLPALLMFVPGVVRSGRKGWYAGAIGLALFLTAVGHEYQIHGLHRWFVPFMNEPGCIFGASGVYNTWPAWGVRPSAMPTWLRAGLAGLTILGILSWLCVSLGKRSSIVPPANAETVSCRMLAIILVPFTLAYCVLLVPRSLRDLAVDRYLEPLILVALIFLCRQYQKHIGIKLPKASFVFAVAIAGFSVAILQDAFAMYRTLLVAANEVIASGVPRTQFDGGWEYDGLTQILVGGYVHQNDIRIPQGPLMYGHRRTGPCEIPIDVWIPNVEPAYALSFTPDGCGGASSYPPVTYSRWLWPHKITLYVVKDPDLSGKHGLFYSF
jgi:hypothetical protein